jgi:predicted ester cyclase
MDNFDKLERNKKFILSYSMAMNEVGLTKEKMLEFTDNESYIQMVMNYRSAFPDYSIYFEDMTSENDFVIVHGIFRGTHKGEIFGIPATFRKVEFPMMVKYQVLDNKIINAWPMFDQMILFEQLGVINRPV